MKFAAVFCALFSVAVANPVGLVGHGAVLAHAPLVNTGALNVYRSQDNHGNYAFGYDEAHATGGTFRREKGAPGIMIGSYGLKDIDGRVRIVNYVADALGYRASIKTNEPGVEPKDPAATLINKEGIVGVAAAPIVAAAPLAVGHAGIGYAGIGHGYAAPLVSGYSVGIGHGAIAAPIGLGYGLGYGKY